MKRFFPLSLLVIATMVAASCDNEGLTQADDPLAEHRGVATGPSGRLVVMTRNLYLGADDDAIVAALASPDPTDDFPALVAAIQTFGNTYYPARAAAVADEIVRTRPHVVGLQEVSEVEIHLPPLPGLPDTGVNIHVPFLPILLDHLAARGVNYVLAQDQSGANAFIQDFEVNLDVIGEIPGAEIRLVDNDAMLVDADRVTVASAWGQLYSVNLGPIAPGIDLKRGWVGVVASIAGESYTIVSTHLEAGHFLPELTLIRAAQAAELVGSLSNDLPAIVMGDLNDWVDTPMYQALVAGGLTDVWAALRPGVEGLTCCHLKDLSNAKPDFYERIDYVWTRGIGHPRSGVGGQVFRTGLLPFERIEGPAYEIWPSDHAGLVARLRVQSSLRIDRF